jgi:hypothetical protein
MAKTKESLESIIGDINKRLDSIEELTLWLTKAELRFKKNQRVRLSQLAHRRNVTVRGPGKGKVLKVEGFTVTVLPDGYKKPHTYWHGYWESVGKARK